MDRLNGVAKASDLIGMAINNYQGDQLGKVSDLALDVESGRIVQVMVLTGGFLGLGEGLTAVPPGALHHDVANKVLHLDANQEKLKGAPRFETLKWAECCDFDHLSSVYGYFGEEPSFQFIHRGDAALDGLRDPDGQVIRNTSPNVLSTRRADGAAEKERISGDRRSIIPVSRLSKVRKASELLRTSVENHQGVTLGKVDNLLLDLAAGRIVAVIVASGGFLGMGDELSAVPPTALRFRADRDVLQLDTTKEMLSSAPHFKANEWPDFGRPSYTDGVYRAYEVQPYFSTNVTTAPDNTASNVRDRNHRTLTPLDQGNSKSDVNTTARIRKQIVAGKEMSVNAKNVKIITSHGRVTLRGPVDTEEEKRLIGVIAIDIALVENVDNQLEVK